MENKDYMLKRKAYDSAESCSYPDFESDSKKQKMSCEQETKPFMPCPVNLVCEIEDTDCDVVCIVGENHRPELCNDFEKIRSYDMAFDKVVSCFKSEELQLPVIYSPIHKLDDYHDVRSYHKIATKCMQRVVMSGFKKPLLIVPTHDRMITSHLCAILGALEELYIPLHQREDENVEESKIEFLSVMIEDFDSPESILEDVFYLEPGLFVARDIGMSDPERMAPEYMECYIRKVFEDSCLLISVVNDSEILSKQYPLFAAVDRANSEVERHKGRIIYIEYKPQCEAEKTLILVGKGVAFDTGGADIKIKGGMKGMSRDKYGAATIVGIMQIVDKLAPKDVHVIAAICVLRNSVGVNCYVSDEIITSRAGLRVRVNNTDAEGRMCMADVLCNLKEHVIEQCLPNPHLFTIATLTGHAIHSAGTGYAIIMDNSVAQSEKHALEMQAVGTEYGEPLEISKLRPDDFEFNKGKVPGEDLVQLGYDDSIKSQRGHQVAAAFLLQASGLEDHGLDSSNPMKYTHIDIAGSACNYPNMPKSTPILTLAKMHLN